MVREFATLPSGGTLLAILGQQLHKNKMTSTKWTLKTLLKK
jgi:hypothetical protein